MMPSDDFLKLNRNPLGPNSFPYPSPHSSVYILHKALL